jgi:CheY-like chemotaxis protein
MILIVDDTPLFRDPIAACLKLAGFETMCASDGVEALAAIRKLAPQLILLDLAMPRMDGLTLLRQLRGNASTAQIPVILLTAYPDKQSVVQAARLGITDYLLKSHISTQQLIDRVRQKLNIKPSVPKASAPEAPQPAAAPVTRLLDAEECIRRVRNSDAARALSGIVAQVIQAASNPTTDLTEMASLVSRDVTLSARILSVAGSTAYSAGHKRISTIPDAVRRIGCAGIRTIAAAVGVFDAVPMQGGFAFNLLRAWQHSFAVAKLCEQFAQLRGGDDAGIAFAVGLCHDLGDIMYHSQFAQENEKILEAQRSTGRPMEELEREMLGTSCRRLAISIIQEMGLPDAICAPIRAFLENKSARQGAPPLTEILRLAEYFANALCLHGSEDAGIAPIGRAECKAVLGNEKPTPLDGPQIRAEVLALIATLARLSPAQEKQLTDPGFKAQSTPIWLARDASFSPFDPIELFLSAIGPVDVHEKLPSAGEIKEHRGLVIVSRTTSGQHNAGEIEKVMSSWPGGRPAMVWLVPDGEKSQGESQVSWRKWPIRVAEIVGALAPVGSGKQKALAA